MARRASRKKALKRLPTWAIVLAVILLIVIIGGYYYYENYYKKETFIQPTGELSFHFMTLGNNYNGDSIYVKAGDVDILIDAGSRAGSVTTIQSYINQYCKDNILEYVIVTHADRDHIAGFAASESLFDLYECKTIIDFDLTNKTTDTYKQYITNRDEEVANGAVHYTALECWNEENGAKKSYQLTDSITMNILYNYYYEHKSNDENNYSVCVQFEHGSKKFLLTGDLEEDGEEYLVQYNDLSEVELYKAGHHGSKTSSNDVLLEKIKPKIVCTTCVAGSVEFLTTAPQNLSNSFPTQAFIDRVSQYTDKVYVTSTINIKFDEEKNKYVNDGDAFDLNGNIIVSSGEDGVTVNCSNNNTLLKDTEWFKENRIAPAAWKQAA